MNKTSVAAVICLILALSACANTARGVVKDAKNTGQAMDDSTRKVLKASSNQ